MVNDGLQPWFSDREKFGLRAMKTREYLASEEGLATLNTIISANSKYLFRAALQYCKSLCKPLFSLLDKFNLNDLTPVIII